MSMRQKIHFTGKNLNDVFHLPCVEGIIKGINDLPFVELKPDHTKIRLVQVGDWLVEEDDGTWRVERGGRP